MTYLSKSYITLVGSAGLLLILAPIVLLLAYDRWTNNEEIQYAEEPIPPERPFPGAEKLMSISDAHTRVSFELPLPNQLTGDWAPMDIWAPREDRLSGSHEEVQVRFSNGVLLSVFTDVSPPRHALEKIHPDMTRVQLGDYKAQVDDPEVKVIHGQKIREPGVIIWWQNGTRVHLYSDTHSKEALAAAAEMFVR